MLLFHVLACKIPTSNAHYRRLTALIVFLTLTILQLFLVSWLNFFICIIVYTDPQLSDRRHQFVR